MSSLFVSALLMGCSETKDDNPVLNLNPDPEASLYQDFLNKPEMANQMIELTEANMDGYIHLTCSQPDYGYAAVAGYNVELSFSEDFSSSVVPDAPASVTLKTLFTDCAQINPNNDDVANAICKMLALTDDSTFPQIYNGPLYVRLVSNIYSIEGSLVPGTTYTSNAVSFYRVSVGYMAASIPNIPAGVFLRGGMNNWGNDALQNSDLTPEEMSELIYPWQFYSTDEKGVYTLPENVTIAGGTEFKVADKSWGTVNEGSNGNSFKIGTSYKLAHGGGNLNCSDDFYGTVTLEVTGGVLPAFGSADIPDGLTYTLTFKQVTEE